MILVCMYCKKQEPKEPLADSRETHGICIECEDIFNRYLDAEKNDEQHSLKEFFEAEWAKKKPST